MANNFNYYSPTEVVFGKGTHAQTGAYVKKYGDGCGYGICKDRRNFL